ncbi:MAG: helix-turn-helix domain-containing protein [Firmicutes bacterium]|nr:helix-turn-helix domain-containing protein [Bacillota bacterium]
MYTEKEGYILTNGVSKQKKKKLEKTLQEAVHDTLQELIQKTSQEYPLSLKVEHLAEITGYSENSIYLMLEKGDIPGAKKIKGWRVPRDTFLLWWHGDWFNQEMQDKQHLIR